MEQNQRPPHHDARLEAVRRLSERAKACAQWRGSGQRAETLRGGTVRPELVEAARSGPSKRGDHRSRA